MLTEVVRGANRWCEVLTGGESSEVLEFMMY